ncbi:MAG: flavoprotein [bacterium]|jgi:phosphopantothenoylcysteine decarboxylase/phosphopantothenate--cysteine ligase|nr:hypothetical protein [Planctomycetota bacterium]HIL52553.1 hypothetical protein [Planctomycetota bacterium]
MSRIVLGVSASAAIYKACDLTSCLTQAGDEVRVVLTRRAAELVSPQLFEAISGQSAHVDEFGPGRESAMDHIALARWAEALVVAPATAHTTANLATGMAGNLLCSLALAADPARTQRLIAPAMNPVMFKNPALQRNLAQLVEDGWTLCEPDFGRLACDDEGQGRLADPERIAARLGELLGR